MPPIPKTPPDVAARYRAILESHPDAEGRTMFGCPSAFVRGNLALGLYGADWFVRLPADARADLLAMDGAMPFAPMPGRPMREYVVLPPAIVSDDDELHAWVARAIAFTASLPPKQPKSRRGRATG